MGMSPIIGTCSAALLLVFVGIFGAFFWKEKGKDEREEYLKYQVGRLAFWAGSGVIALGIVTQKFTSGTSVDPWLAIALAAMLFTKVGGSYYMHRTK